jgi:hypothetical protein
MAKLAKLMSPYGWASKLIPTVTYSALVTEWRRTDWTGEIGPKMKLERREWR